MADYEALWPCTFDFNEVRSGRLISGHPLSYAYYGFRTPTLQELYFVPQRQPRHRRQPGPGRIFEQCHGIAFTHRGILHNARIRLTTTLSGFYNVFKDKIRLAQNVDILPTTPTTTSAAASPGRGAGNPSLALGGLRVNVSLARSDATTNMPPTIKPALVPLFARSELRPSVTYIAKSGVRTSVSSTNTPASARSTITTNNDPGQQERERNLPGGTPLLPLRGHHRHAEADLVPEPRT